MKSKLGALLLLCLVTVSLFYGLRSIASSGHEIQSMHAVPSGPTTVIETLCQDTQQSYPRLVPLGDEVDDPTPAKH